MSWQKAYLGCLRNVQEMNTTNSWIFLALHISNPFSIDMPDKRRINIYFIQEFVISMNKASVWLELVSLSGSCWLPQHAQSSTFPLCQGCQNVRPARKFFVFVIVKNFFDGVFFFLEKKHFFWTTFFLEKRLYRSGPLEKDLPPCGPWAKMSLTPLLYVYNSTLWCERYPLLLVKNKDIASLLHLLALIYGIATPGP